MIMTIGTKGSHKWRPNYHTILRRRYGQNRIMAIVLNELQQEVIAMQEQTQHQRRDHLDELERTVEQLAPLAEQQLRAADLLAKGYEPYHETLRKVVGDLTVCYRQVGDGHYFEFACVMRCRE